MGESKHTPGPWRLDHAARGAGFSVVAASPKRAGGGNRICTCRPASYSPEAHDEAEANARLIAAAPDLLEELKNLLAAYEQPDRQLCCHGGQDCGCRGATVHSQAQHYARAAIAKAEGK